MANITSQQKFQNFRDVTGMMEDYKEQFNRFPTMKEFEEKLGMPERTVRRYKIPIIKLMKKKISNKFNDNMIIHIEKTLNALNKHSKMCEEIRDETSNSNEKIIASRNVVEANLDAINLIGDTEQYLKIDDDNVSKNEQEYNYRETEKEARTEESIESMFN